MFLKDAFLLFQRNCWMWHDLHLTTRKRFIPRILVYKHTTNQSALNNLTGFELQAFYNDWLDCE